MTAVLAAAAWPVAALLVLELALRTAGFGSFPLFERAAQGRYRMAPNQEGVFRRRHAWRYDANGMRNERTPASFAETTLLVGDSIVDGGLRIAQSETLAAVAGRVSGESFYTVACHGWALANSLPALKAVPGWTGAKRLAFVLNTGDLDQPGELQNELSFPTRRPIWLTLWLVRRHLFRKGLYPRLAAAGQRAMQPPCDWRAANLNEFAGLLSAYSGPILLVRYAMRGEDAHSERYFEQLAALEPRISLLEAADAPGWSDECYIDHIHPNRRGVELLATHICRSLS